MCQQSGTTASTGRLVTPHPRTIGPQVIYGALWNPGGFCSLNLLRLNVANGLEESLGWSFCWNDGVGGTHNWPLLGSCAQKLLRDEERPYMTFIAFL